MSQSCYIQLLFIVLLYSMSKAPFIAESSDEKKVNISAIEAIITHQEFPETYCSNLLVKPP